MGRTKTESLISLTNRRTRFGTHILFLLILLVPSMVFADMGDILSRFQFYGIVQETYDNNVNLTPRDKLNDFITNAGVGVRFSTQPRSETTGEFLLPAAAEMSKFGIYLDFLPTYVIYAKHASDDYLNLSGNLDTWYTWGGKLTFRVRDYLIRSEEPLEPNYAATALPGQILLGSPRGRAIYIRNVAQPSIEYRFGAEDIVSVNYLNNVYRSARFENSTENYINPKITYWLTMRHGVSLEYALDLGHFQSTPDMTGNLGRGRYTYRFNPRTSIFGEYTFQRREFQQSVTTPTTDYDIHSPVVGFDHGFSPTLSLSAQVGYFWAIPQRGSNETGIPYRVVLTQTYPKTTYTLGFQGGYIEDFYTAENLGFAKYHQVIGTITHQLTQRASVTLAGRYQRPKFRDGRVDNLWGVTTGASYRILRWLTLALNFSYDGNHSDIELNNYTDFRGMFGVTGTY